MVQELPRTRSHGSFPETAPTAYPVFYRTYSRKGETPDGGRETWEQVCDRNLTGLVELGGLTPEEHELLARMQREIKASGINPVSKLDWSDHIPPEWPARTLLWMCSPAADRFMGEEIALRDEDIRREVGLI